MNVIKALYSDIKKGDVNIFEIEEQNIEWCNLSGKFVDSFSLGSRIPVGKVTSNGVEFKLNYLNYYLVVPKVTVVQEGSRITVTQNYDIKARMMQYYWLSIWVFSLAFMVLMQMSFIFNTEVFIKDLGPVLFFVSLICLVLFAFVRIRQNIWTKTIQKTMDILSIVGVNEI